MDKLKLTIVGMVCVMVIMSSCHPPKEKTAKLIPLKDFFRNPEKSGYQISPDGKYYSYMAPYEKRMNVFVQEMGKKDAIRLTSEKDRDISTYFWKNSNRILYLKDNGGDENFKLYGVNVDGSNLKCYTDFDKVRTQLIDDLEDIPAEVIIGLNKRDPQVFDAYRLNIETGEMKMIAENPGNISGWMTDHDGKLRVATATDGVNTSILYRETENDKFKVVLTTNFKESVNPVFFTFDNKNVYAVSNLGRDKSAIVEFDIAKGKEIKEIYKNADYDVSDVSYSRLRKVLTSASYVSWKTENYFFDDETKKMNDRFTKEFGNKEIFITGNTKAEDKFIVRTVSDRSKGTYYIYDKKTDKLDSIHTVAPWLDENELAEMKPIEYKSRDGLTIHGYLTLPKGKEAKNLPVVINPHGGPWYRDQWVFNSEVQFLANRGYAVLQMNFRGSTGYGRKFWECSFKQWGLTMQDDISDGVKWLINRVLQIQKELLFMEAAMVVMQHLQE